MTGYVTEITLKENTGGGDELQVQYVQKVSETACGVPPKPANN